LSTTSTVLDQAAALGCPNLTIFEWPPYPSLRQFADLEAALASLAAPAALPAKETPPDVALSIVNSTAR
jgi:hypothetical protein